MQVVRLWIYSRNTCICGECLECCLWGKRVIVQICLGTTGMTHLCIHEQEQTLLQNYRWTWRKLGHDWGQNTLLLSGMSWNICFPLLALHSALWMKFTPATGVYIQLQDYTTKTKNLLGNLRTIFPSCQACLLIPTPFQLFTPVSANHAACLWLSSRTVKQQTHLNAVSNKYCFFSFSCKNSHW